MAEQYDANMKSPEWTDKDWALAHEAFDREFPKGQGLGVWTASVDTTRGWAGTEHDLSSFDTRLQFKNNAEYHGMEVYAWQFMATGQYSEASDHFYTAALWREIDAESIDLVNPGHPGDPGHHKAIEICIRMGRYCRALARAQKLGKQWPEPDEFNLDPKFVSDRETRAERQINDAVGQV